jgi:nucleotide sugar dehydrogenase
MKTNHVLASESDSILSVVQKIDSGKTKGGAVGIAVVVDKSNVIKGVVTDGDIRRAISDGIDFSVPVREIMTTKYTFVYDDLSRTEQLKVILEQVRRVGRLDDPRSTRVIVCKRNYEFVDIVNLLDVYKYGDVNLQRISIYGMGFVGLTLALTFAELNQLDITGVDIDEDLVRNLNKGVSAIYEEGLQSLLSYCNAKKTIAFKHSKEDVDADIHIIVVGTPVDANNKPDYSSLENVVKQIGKSLKQYDTIICRSTVPVGTTRNFIIPILEKSSGMKVGKDFHVAFAPERTVEGKALKELKLLPQVVGGYSEHCCEVASKLFYKITPSIVKVKSLEAAEIVKMVNNTFRDTVFAFANEVALLCDNYNLDAYELIENANEGYPRNVIPSPSPGVGGICLTKDPYLYSYNNDSNISYVPQFGKISRSTNKKMPEYVYQKYIKFINDNNLKLHSNNIKVLVVGITFKGIPETSDTRNSPAMDLIALLKKDGATVLGYDQVLTIDDINALGIIPVSMEDGIVASNAVFIMNNHPQNTRFDIYSCLTQTRKPFLFFDGWRLFNKYEIRSIPGVLYSTLGFSSNDISFYATEIEKYVLRKDTNTKLTIHLPQEKDIILLSHDDRRKREETMPQKSLLWAAGGGSYVLGEKYMPLVKRSADSPSNPCRLTISTGLSDYFEEMINPTLLIRELFEEIVILDKDENLLIPKFTGEDVSNLRQINHLSETAITLASKRAGISWKGVRFVKANIVKNLLIDEVEVICSDLERTSSALIHHDEMHGTINVLFAILLPELNSIKELSFFDTEMHISANRRSYPLDRKIFLYDLETNDLLSTDKNEVVNDAKPLMTSHAEFLIEYIQKEGKVLYG